MTVHAREHERIKELSLTVRRLLSVWWLILWRGIIGGFILGLIPGALAGIAVELVGHPELASIAGGFAGFALMPFWWLLIVHMALKKRYKDFRIMLAPR